MIERANAHRGWKLYLSIAVGLRKQRFKKSPVRFFFQGHIELKGKEDPPLRSGSKAHGVY